MIGARARLEAISLLVIGLGTLWFALAGDYGRLMNPDFRWVTVTGAGLVTLMGLALWVRPRQRADGSALAIFGVFLLVVVTGRPYAPGVSPLLAATEDRPPMIEREGYAPLEVRSLFERLDKEVADVAEGTHVLGGLVYRSPELDADGIFLLIEPMMACCLADAVGYGIRVKATGPMPEPQRWVYVYGKLERLPEPVLTSRFRMGAIVFITVSQTYAFLSEDVVTFRSLLADVVDQVPEDRCSIFRSALESSGLAETLRGEGPFTLFVPLDLAFEGTTDAARERPALEAFVVEGAYTEDDLFKLDTLTTMSGRALRVESVNGKLRVEGARILFGDQIAKNGYLHIVHPAWLPR